MAEEARASLLLLSFSPLPPSRKAKGFRPSLILVESAVVRL
jgi:hypothetical protein